MATTELTGADLVAEVARKVMRWPCVVNQFAAYPLVKKSPDVPIMGWMPLDSICEAWQVVENRQAAGWEVEVTVYRDGSASCFCRKDGRQCVGAEDTAQESILRAALLTVDK